jgi:Na+/proline symporter
MTGGLRGVVATDIVQFALALAGTILYAIFVVRAAGGLGAMTGELAEIYGSQRSREMLSFTPQAGAAFLPFLAVMSLQWLFQRNSDGTGYLAQRSMACTDEHQARLACVLFAWLQILLRSLPWLLIAVGLLVLHPFTPAEAQGDTFAATREMLFVQEIDRLLPVGVRGLLLTGMLAALASTLDTHMNWGASYWSNDIYQRLICRAWLKRTPGGHELVVVARLANLLILAIALLIMANLGSIQQAWRISLVFGAGVGSVLVLRWLWERINVWAELAAMGVSLVAAPLVLYAGKHRWFGSADDLTLEALNLGAMAVISTLATVVVARLTPPTDRRTLAAFYKQVRPAGFWARTAREAGEDAGEPVRKLRAQVATTALAGLSLFLCLYGSARLLIPHPAVHGVIPLVILLIGLALVPVWWRRGGKR